MAGKQGFASMAPEKRRAIAALGGRAVQAKGTAHQYTSEEARVAGRLGGMATVRRRQMEGEQRRIQKAFVDRMEEVDRLIQR